MYNLDMQTNKLATAVAIVVALTVIIIILSYSSGYPNPKAKKGDANTDIGKSKRRIPISDKPIKNWETRRYEEGELAAIVRGSQAVATGRDEFDIKNPVAVILTKPQANEQPKKVNYSADEGHYSEAEKFLTLVSNVKVEIPIDETILKTNSLAIYLDSKKVTTDDKFTLDMPQIKLSGEGLIANEAMSKVVIKKDAHIVKSDSDGTFNMSADYVDMNLIKKNSAAQSMDYDIADYVAISKGFSRVIKSAKESANTLEIAAPKISGSKEITTLQGPKQIRFANSIAGCDGDAVFDSASNKVRLFTNAFVSQNDSTISANQMTIKLSKDGKSVQSVDGIGSVALDSKVNNTQIFGDVFNRDFNTGISKISGDPYAYAYAPKGVLQIGELIFDDKNNTIEGRRGKNRSVAKFEYEEKKKNEK